MNDYGGVVRDSMSLNTGRHTQHISTQDAYLVEYLMSFHALSAVYIMYALSAPS